MNPPSRVSWDEVQKVQLYCHKVRIKLGLMEWRSAIGEESADDDANANISSPIGRFTASINLCVGWEELPPAKKRAVLLHEMLHLLHQRTTHQVLMLTEDHNDLSADRQEAISDALRVGNEYMVDHLTTALMAIPNWTPRWPTLKEAQHANIGNGDPAPWLEGE